MTVDHTSLYGGCAHILAGTAQILDVYRRGKFLCTGRKSGMPGNHGKAGSVIVPLDHVEPGDLAHNAALHHCVAQAGCLDELIAGQDHGEGVRGDQQIPLTIVRDILLGHLGADIHNGCVDVCLAECAHPHAGSTGKQYGCTVHILLPCQGIACAVQSVSHQIVRHRLGVKAVNDLIDRLILVDGECFIRSAAGAGGDAVRLVIVGHLHLCVPNRDLDGTCLGAALVVCVEYHAVLQLVLLADFRQDQGRITLLRIVCHISLPPVT